MHLVSGTASTEPLSAERSRIQLQLAAEAMARHGRPAPLVRMLKSETVDAATQPLVEYIRNVMPDKGIELFEGSLEELKSDMFGKPPKPAPKTAAWAVAKPREMAVLVEDGEAAEIDALKQLLTAKLGVKPLVQRFTGSTPKDAGRLAKVLADCPQALVVWHRQDDDWVQALLDSEVLAGHASPERLAVYVMGEGNDMKTDFATPQASPIRALVSPAEAELAAFVKAWPDGIRLMAGEHALALIAANPFPGLRAFKPGESDRFFGRGQQIAELATHLDALPFLAVSGASGCGKSSLVLAGLLTELRERHADGHGADWRPVVMRPGNRLIERLAEALAHVLHDDEDEDLDHTLGDLAEQRLARSGALFGQLRLGGQGLVEAVRQSRLARRSPAARVLLVVDQFEEVFRFKRMSDPDESAAFGRLLLAAAHDPASPVSVVITLRSDALGNCAEFHDLPEAVSRGGYLVLLRLKR
ncbi:ATP-binding protein [Paucibacter sp. O1-1]|nr:ATP-binding protein [Paucibacter sp. O1-1]MDA3831396.1 ATP-binding protein [Paucibacter sp. O1-1]